MSFIMDETKVQQNLVYDKYTYQLIGYVYLGDPQLNFSIFNDCNALASYILVFYLRGILCDFEFAMAYFATKRCYLIPDISIVLGCCGNFKRYF